MENKYDFPPPVDKDLYFGTCLLVRVNETGLIIDLDAPTWSKIYEKIFKEKGENYFRELEANALLEIKKSFSSTVQLHSFTKSS